MKRFSCLFLLVIGLLLGACGSTELSTSTWSTAEPTMTPLNEIPATPRQTPAARSAQPVDAQTHQFSALTDSQGAISVSVKPFELDNSQDTLDFKVSLDTHSVDLSMDLAALATLTTDTGQSVQAEAWDAPLGGHHVSGTLSFPASVEGNPILVGASRLTLTLINVDVPERVFVWDIR